MVNAEKPFHALMFHHFHGDGHHIGQGSISADEFAQMIEYIGPDNILDGSEWLNRFQENSLEKKFVCLTFDDALKCQIDIAIPVLNEYKIKGLFYIYSSVFEGVAEKLEIYRYFRTVYFDSIDDFYTEFKEKLLTSQYANKVNQGLAGFDEVEYLNAFPFYSTADKEFRYIRDKILGQNVYYEFMDEMIADADIDIKELTSTLWMNNEDLTQLHRQGHELGLHSYSHPTSISSLSRQAQFQEYNKNASHLKLILNQVPRSVSYPCGSYNKDSIEVLKSLGINMGFRSSLAPVPDSGAFEIAREDHANILVAMRSAA